MPRLSWANALWRSDVSIVFFFVSDESSTAVGPFSAAEMWPQFMLPRQHSGGPAPDNRNGGENHVLNPESNGF